MMFLKIPCSMICAKLEIQLSSEFLIGVLLAGANLRLFPIQIMRVLFPYCLENSTMDEQWQLWSLLAESTCGKP